MLPSLQACAHSTAPQSAVEVLSCKRDDISLVHPDTNYVSTPSTEYARSHRGVRNRGASRRSERTETGLSYLYANRDRAFTRSEIATGIDAEPEEETAAAHREDTEELSIEPGDEEGMGDVLEEMQPFVAGD